MAGSAAQLRSKGSQATEAGASGASTRPAAPPAEAIPRYLAGSEPVAEPTVNVCQAAEQQADYAEAVSGSVESLSVPEPVASEPPLAESETESTEDAEPEEEEEAGEAEEDKEEEAAEGEGEGAEADGEAGTDDAEAEATGKEADSEGEQDEGAAAAGAGSGPAATGAAGQGSGEAESPAELAALLPRMSPIPTPVVPSPPAPAVQRRSEIIKRTGSPPEMHHALVRLAAERVAQAARDAQRRMLFRVGNLARESRVSMEALAAEVPAAAEAAVAQIAGAIDTVIADIKQIAKDEQAHIEQHGVLTGEALQASRDKMSVDIFKQLQASSATIQEAATLAQTRFNGQLATAQQSLSVLPASGKAPRLSTGDGGGDRGSGGGDGGKGATAPDSKYKVIAEASAELTTWLGTQSDVISDGKANVKTYLLARSTPVLKGLSSRTDGDLGKQARKRSEQLGSAATKAQFSTMVLSLTTPVSEHHQEDKGKAVDKGQASADSQLTEAQLAVKQAKEVIQGNSDRAVEYCEKDLRVKLPANIRKSGGKAYQNLRKQARTAETTLNNSAAGMAEAYRGLVARLDALLPPNQFLDSRSLVPRLTAARDSAEKLRFQHEDAAKRQGAEAMEQFDKGKRQQVESLAKAGADSAQSVRDVATRTRFDCSMFSSQMTGELSAGVAAGMEAASGYAQRMAEGLLKSAQQVNGEGLKQIDRMAAGFLNGSLGAAEQAQYQALESFVTEMERTGEEGTLTKPMADARKDLEERATAIDNALPGRSTGTTVGLASAATVVPLAGLALAVYAYKTRPQPDVVISKLGNLMWPGAPALEDVFEQTKSDTLRARIENEMSSPERAQALGLMSSSVLARGRARDEIARDSTGWFGYSREARESALQGMSADELGALQELSPAHLERTRQMMEKLDGHERDIALGYLSRNRERVAAARAQESLDKGRKEGEWGWIFSGEEARRRSDEARVQAIAGMQDTLRSELMVESAYIAPGELEARTGRVYQEFASLLDPQHRSAEAFSLEDARASVIGYATKGHQAAVLGLSPFGSVEVQVQRVEMSAEASQYIKDVVNHGVDSDEAKSSRGVYEFRRAEGDSFLGVRTLSETSQTRLSDAFENRKLADLKRRVREARTPLECSRYERQLAEERGKHLSRLQAMARGLNAPEDVAADPERAEQWMAQRVGGLFSRTDDLQTRAANALDLPGRPSHSRYGAEMITHGRASLAAGVALATDGVGTHEELLRRSYQDRSHDEIAAARLQWQAERGEDLDEMLGLKQRTLDASDYAMALASPVAWLALRGPETSGDLAMELERLAQGNRETDLDNVRFAGLHYNQERVRGTGFIARQSMQGTPEQQSLDGRRERLAQIILEAAAKGNPELAARYRENPGALFRPDGSIDPAVEAAAFDKGNFRGDRSLLQHYTQSVSLAADSYRAEIDRQEAILTSGITVLALVASIALMLVPGVNVVAAGVISAIVAGAATIAVKAGMRGERYGWEEAATDVAMTAIEAATAGFGGAMAGGLKAGGALAKIGPALTSRFGKVGGTMAREAIVNALSQGAQAALQDDVWKDGLGRGLERVANGAIRGAVVSAVTAGVSEHLTHRLNTSMALRDVDPAKLSRMQRLGQALGPHGSEVFREGITNMAGNLAGESVGVMSDYARGEHRGKFGDALLHIGEAGVRELATGGFRGGVMSMNRARYRSLLEAARSGVELSPQDLRALRLAAISAGAMHYDDGPAKVRAEIEAGRQLLAQLPPAMREPAASLDAGSLEHIIHMLDTGHLGNEVERATFLRELGESAPGLDGRALMAEIEKAAAGRGPASEAEAAADPARQKEVRRQLGEGLGEKLRPVVDEARVEGLERLSEGDLKTAAEMIARGRFDSDTADALLRDAKRANPDLNEFTFLRNLHGAVEGIRLAQEAETRILAKQRAEALRDIPPGAHGVFARLPDEALGRVRAMLEEGHAGSPEQQAALLREAREFAPELDSHQLKQSLEQAAANAQTRRATARAEARAERQRHMSNIPGELRGTLSVLPRSALVELHLRQMEGRISPAERLKLVEAALRENPQLDLPAFHQALDAAIQHGAPIRPGPEEARAMRRELLAAVPEGQRALVAEVPILVLPDADFAAYTRSFKGDAVTLMLDGRPVVLLRQGADAAVLREEGLHALQSKDPRWAERMGALDERHLDRWHELSLEQQMALYRNKLELEIDAHHRLAESLAEELGRTRDPAEAERLRARLELAGQALHNLQRRQREAGAVGVLQRRMMEAGMLARPDWLEQPARLFGKKTDPAHPAQGPPARKASPAELERATEGLTPDGSQARKVKALVERLDPARRSELLALGLGGAEIRKVLSAHDTAEATHGLVEHLRDIAAALPEGSAGPILKELIRRDALPELASRLHEATALLGGDAPNAKLLAEAVVMLEGRHLDAIDAVLQFMKQALPEQRTDFVQLLGEIKDGNGRIRLLDLMAQLRTNPPRNLPQGTDIQALLAGLVGAAATVHHKVDLFERADVLLRAIASAPESPARTQVLEHIAKSLAHGADDIMRDHALDIRAAAELATSGTLALATLRQFAEAIAKDGLMSGGDAFQLHLREKLAEWPAFKTGYPEFAKLLEATFPRLGDAERAVLADLQPWFSHVVKSEWFQQRVRAAGGDADAVMSKLLRDVVAQGLNAKGGLANLDGLRHIMREMRETVIDSLPEPHFVAEVQELMRAIGYSEEALAARHGENFAAVLAADRAKARATPEAHLEDLLRQKIIYEHLSETAKAVAAEHFPGDEAGQRRLVSEMMAGLRQKITETEGEIAATHAILSDERFKGFVLHQGFEPGIGFDQVWVRYDGEGRISEILIVEAKGPGATTQETRTKGHQMSEEWVARTVIDQIMHGDDAHGTANLIYDAIVNGHPPIKGVVVEAQRPAKPKPGSAAAQAPGQAGAIHGYGRESIQQAAHQAMLRAMLLAQIREQGKFSPERVAAMSAEERAVYDRILKERGG